ncbi:hypothetical protein ACFX2I_045540 [Malus domestica]
MTEPIESSMFSGKRNWNVERWIAPMGRAFLLVRQHSMSNVETDRQMLDGQTMNSLEIVGVSTKPRNTKFSRNLIALLCHGGVPKDYFMELLMKDLENTRGVFCNRHAATKDNLIFIS